MEEPRQILENLRRLQSLIDILSWIANRFDKAVDAIERQQAIDDVLREMDGYLHNNFDRIDRTLLLILEKLPEEKSSRRLQKETNRLRQETIKNRVESLRKQLKQYYFNLNWLEEQSAKFGINVSLEITSQIIETKEKIIAAEEEVRYLQEELKKSRVD